MDIQDVKDYIDSLPEIKKYSALEDPEKESAIFYAMEVLKNQFPRSRNLILSEFVVSEQVKHSLESTDPEFKRLIENGVASYSVTDVSVSFDNERLKTIHVSPLALRVLKELNPRLKSGGRVGRLI